MDDLISRQAAIDVLHEYFDGMLDTDTVCPRDIYGSFECIPSAQPKTGKWIYDYTTADGHKTYHCSVCGCFLKPKHSESLNSFKWCSLCGTKMEVEKNG